MTVAAIGTFRPHPSTDKYVNVHKYVLHLWREQSGHELPPTNYV